MKVIISGLFLACSIAGAVIAVTNDWTGVTAIWAFATGVWMSNFLYEYDAL